MEISDASIRKHRGKPVRIRHGRATVRVSWLHKSLGKDPGKTQLCNDPKSGNLLITTRMTAHAELGKEDV